MADDAKCFAGTARASPDEHALDRQLGESRTQPHTALSDFGQGQGAARMIPFAAPSTSQSNGTTTEGKLHQAADGWRLFCRGDGSTRHHHSDLPSLFCVTLSTLFTTLWGCLQALPHQARKCI